MDGNRTSGTARNPSGKSEEGRAAEAAGNGQPRAEKRSIQDLYGQAVDAAGDSIDAVRQMPGCLDDTVRRYIETKPYTTALIALGIGWLIGRSHRPF